MISIYKYGEVSNDEIFARVEPAFNVEQIVADIIADVRARGDEALFHYCQTLDRAELTSLEVSPEEIAEALTLVEPEFLDILREAAENIRAFHEKQVRNSFIINEKDGVVIGQKIIPMEKAGLYVPGGTAAYPSTVLMDSIPAKIAGCKELVITTPPNAQGKVNPVILAAAHVAGVDRIFKCGGAQAIAALAYGTESVPKVDKIVGPGNIYVALAKRMVYGMVSIDMIAGPSEILIVADETASPKRLAADLLSQAEHDKLATAVLVTDSLALAEATQAEVERQAALLPRGEIVRASLDNNSKIIVVEDLEKAVDMANEIAPEHLELCVSDPFALKAKIKNAGSIFLGHFTPESLGDYLAGPNHTLPTGGSARFSSPLSVDDFVKKSSYLYYPEEALKRVAEPLAEFARAEGLEAHARAALVRFEEESGK